MNDCPPYADLLTVLGIVGGAFASWIITHEYHRRSAERVVTLSRERPLVSDIDRVWATLTDPANVGHLDWRRPTPDLFATLTIGQPLGGTPAGAARPLYVVEMQAPRLLGWGDNPAEWDTRIALLGHAGTTTLVLSRRFGQRIDPWWAILADRLLRARQPMAFADLVDEDLDRIARLFPAPAGGRAGQTAPQKRADAATP